MGYGNWDDLLSEYNEIYLNSRYHEHAQSMIELIPKIRNASIVSTAIPISSHATLCLQLPVSHIKVCVWGEANEIYRVYLYDYQTNGNSDEVLVGGDQIISTLQAYLNRIG